MTEVAPRERRLIGVVLWSCALLVALVVAGLVWLGFRMIDVAGTLGSFPTVAEDMTSAAAARDLDALVTASDTLSTRSRRAADATSEPIWRAGEMLPVLGANLTALRVVSAQMDAVAHDAVVPLLTIARALESGGTTADGGLDLRALTDARAPLTASAHVLATAAASLNALEPAGLLPPVRHGVEALTGTIDGVAPIVSDLADATAVLPAILGADRTRTILVMVQNNAELRTGGGITGTFVLVRMQQGRASIVRIADSSLFPPSERPLVGIPSSTTALYGDVVGRFVQNASMTPDFPITARLASSWWQRLTGHTPDAVLSIDPFVISSLLGTVGPVTLPDGSLLSADDFAARLLVDPYFQLDSDGQTRAQRTAIESVFAHLLGGRIDPLTWAAGLRAPIEQGRVSLWSADTGEQAQLGASVLGGPLARLTRAGAGAYALYFNDATAGKMDGYLEVEAGISSIACRPDGRQEVEVALRMRSTAPDEARSAWPISMTGGGLFGTAVGDIGTSVTVAAPVGALFGGVTKNGELTLSTDVVDNGHPSSVVRVNLSPGEENDVVFRFITDASDTAAPSLVVSPTYSPVTIDDGFRASCAG